MTKCKSLMHGTEQNSSTPASRQPREYMTYGVVHAEPLYAQSKVMGADLIHAGRAAGRNK